jgi:hypothetical protein
MVGCGVFGEQPPGAVNRIAQDKEMPFQFGSLHESVTSGPGK